MVGAAVGLGGKLMRTVSFFGCTLPVDFFSGSAPVGAPGSGLFGGKSAIYIINWKISAPAWLSNLILVRKEKFRTGIARRQAAREKGEFWIRGLPDQYEDDDVDVDDVDDVDDEDVPA